MLNFDAQNNILTKHTINFSNHIHIEVPVKRVFLWGMMGSGKSSLGKKLANALQWDLIDLDKRIEEERGSTILQIFNRDGEEEFRKLERQALEKAVKSDHAVISVGGGTPCFLKNDALMKAAGLCVWLDAPLAMLASRLANAKEERPLLKGLDEGQIVSKLELLYAERQGFYAGAHMIVSINKMSVSESTALLSAIIRDKS